MIQIPTKFKRITRCLGLEIPFYVLWPCRETNEWGYIYTHTRTQLLDKEPKRDRVVQLNCPIELLSNTQNVIFHSSISLFPLSADMSVSQSY